ncbi:SDR family oxidoreductase [Pararhodonellum marinum]|uniref:SDR family oxidoreductase n=1 Tax=Pararhodonellum marinum TaxID=2755358 RepID=UPI00188E46E4|nr:SDR family oxidoreductase [Pararhodonellum marinum]
MIFTENIQKTTKRISGSIKRKDLGNKPNEKVAMVAPGESMVGRSIVLALAKEGIKLVIAFSHDHEKALETQEIAQKISGLKPKLFQGNLNLPSDCEKMVDFTLQEHGKIDIITNHVFQNGAAMSLSGQPDSSKNVNFGQALNTQYFLTRAALPHLKEGATIIHSCSIDPPHLPARLLDYAGFQGCLVAFTHSQAKLLENKGIRVYGVGQNWQHFSFSSPFEHDSDSIEQPGNASDNNQIMATAYVYLTSDHPSPMTGEFFCPSISKGSGSKVKNTFEKRFD